MPSGCAVGADQAACRQKDHAGRLPPARSSAFTSASASTMPVCGRTQRRDRSNRRLARGDERAIDELESFDAVGRAALLQRLELPDFVLVGGDDELAAALVRHAVARAELVQHARVPRRTAAPSASRPDSRCRRG